MIKNVIFDYGNVICKTDIRALIRSFAENEEDFLLMEKAVCENWGTWTRAAIITRIK